MDVVNFDSLKARGKIIKKEDVNLQEDYFILGHYDPRRKEFKATDYPIYAIKAGDILGTTLDETAFYEHDLNDGGIVNVTTKKGVIEFYNLDTYTISPALGNAGVINIFNPEMDYSNVDNVYLQITPYYKRVADDNFIPYVLPTGYVGGADLSIYNLSPLPAGTGQQTGLFYIYYEMYNF